ncbi:MAG TPA: phosphopentomutase [Bacillota bacterium]|nr:phosphopentomutase [Peptococcaceae bacterium MAG4]NLW38407.1 phosphopentomutase [Peptococcaceae bacterium]HPZ42493.1 phosphopentomutase [Bacillota bacterium]HQD75285.1 phosphopentomutase [Bacillota bacterium]HUM57720.1 phosphopentomutase [Bacillota bacterium]
MPLLEVKRVILLVLDSVGAGELPDAAKYGDCGSNTLGNTARAVGGLNLPNLESLGLGNILPLEGVPPAQEPKAFYGKMRQKSAGKDTTTGHWELAGLILERPFPVYPNGFPPEIIEPFEKAIGRRILGNKVASGTAIIDELGERHMETGCPIVYTSADSVFQVAAHEKVIPLKELYEICRIARNILTGEHAVGRVIARPFDGEPGSFYRTGNRHDFSLKPPGQTVLSLLQENRIPVTAIGKISDIFAGEGISASYPTKGNRDTMEQTLKQIRSGTWGLIFANFIDFDMLYGHRNNPSGYAKALEEFDGMLPHLDDALQQSDVVIITGDHGCDPTTPSTDHSREYVPLLVYGKTLQGGSNLGTRDSFTDVAATIAEIFGLPFPEGKSFWRQVCQECPEL